MEDARPEDTSADPTPFRELVWEIHRAFDELVSEDETLHAADVNAAKLVISALEDAVDEIVRDLDVRQLLDVVESTDAPFDLRDLLELSFPGTADDLWHQDDLQGVDTVLLALAEKMFNEVAAEIVSDRELSGGVSEAIAEYRGDRLRRHVGHLDPTADEDLEPVQTEEDQPLSDDFFGG